MLWPTRPNFLILALSLVSLFTIILGARSEESARDVAQARTTLEQNFADFLKAEELATKHANDVIEHALTIFTWIIGVVGSLLIAGAALLGWAIARWNRISKTDIQNEVRTRLQAGVAQGIESGMNDVQNRVNRAMSQINEVETRANTFEGTLTNQQGMIDLLQLLAPVVLSEPDRSHLLNLYGSTTMGYVGNHNVRSELRRLRFLRLITSSQPVASARDGVIFDLKDIVQLTPFGTKWAEQLAKLKQQQEG